MSIKIKDLDSDLGEALDAVSNVIGLELVDEEDELYQTWVEKCYIHIPKYNLNIHDGYILTYNEESGDYELSNEVTFFFNGAGKECIYSEQGSSLDVCIHNYLNLNRIDKKVTMRKTENLDCDFVIDKTFHNFL